MELTGKETLLAFLERRDVFGQVCHVGVAVKNATNVSYRSFLSRYKEFALNPGRNVVMRISLGE